MIAWGVSAVVVAMAVVFGLEPLRVWRERRRRRLVDRRRRFQPSA